MNRRVLIVEDEKAIADIIAFNLKREGYDVLTAYDGNTGLQMAVKEQLELILLDVMLPGVDGFEVLRRIREKSDLPVIMLTAREEEDDKVTGLELGADDYITKPFSMRELIARVNANMRRVLPQKEQNNTKQRTLSGKLTISEDKSEIYKDGIPVDLSVREFDILCFLSNTPDKIFSREELMEKVWGYQYYGDLRAVDVAIRRLREKIEDNPAQPQYIITKRGMGYYFAADV